MSRTDLDAIEAYLAQHEPERLPPGNAKNYDPERKQRQFADLRTPQTGRRIPPRPVGYHWRR